jgi:decaprenylphospho-beta-D-erythro-pentofuranosid-2-ulose 2-reductase
MNLLILGANSDVAWATAKVFAKRSGAALTLASRNMELLDKKVRDIRARYGCEARAAAFDALDYGSHKDFYAGLQPRPDGVILAFGVIGDQLEAQSDFGMARSIIDTNFTGAVSITEIVAADFQRRGSGFIVGISSVAGDRGRKSNYIYGAAKAALTTYLSGPAQSSVQFQCPGHYRAARLY